MHILSAKVIGQLLLASMLSGILAPDLQSQDLPLPKSEKALPESPQKKQKATPSRSLLDTLTELGHRYRVHFNFDSDLLEGKIIEPSRQMPQTATLEEALANLLGPFGLGFEKLNPETFIIFRKKGPGLGAKLAPNN